jgi:hypothetical protein
VYSTALESLLYRGGRQKTAFPAGEKLFILTGIAAPAQNGVSVLHRNGFPLHT